MALQRFEVGPQRALVLAKCDSVPKVMIIAGPNGVGKSTLLYEISQKRGSVTLDPGTRIIYQPPHRAIRKTTIRRSWLNNTQSLFDLYSTYKLPAFDGLDIQNRERRPENVDEAGSAIKHVLGKMENKRQAVVTEFTDRWREGEITITAENLLDIYVPLKELTKYLLPHLVFKRVDFKDENNVKCLWKRKDNRGVDELDIDDLSSGEKSIVLLFLPLIEHDINARLELLEKFDGKVSAVGYLLDDLVVLIDEPELHLHPDLQTRILNYIRSLASDTNTQFVIASQSATILDQALDNELFLLSPPTGTVGDNQLKKVATNLDRLEGLKQLAGTNYFLTTGRSILCVEGEQNPGAAISDVNLLSILFPRSTAFTLVPVKGKGNVINTVERLRDHLPEETFQLRVFGLVDRDRSTTLPHGVFALPVCMIENLLLIPEAILSYLQKVHPLELDTVEKVETELELIAIGMREDEIRIRIQQLIKPMFVRITGSSVSQVQASAAEHVNKIKELVSDEELLAKVVRDTTERVDNIIENGETLIHFRGKEIIREFYRGWISPHLPNKSFAEFCYELAQEVAASRAIESMLNSLFDQIEAKQMSESNESSSADEANIDEPKPQA